jgi:hypothetical protein
MVMNDDVEIMCKKRSEIRSVFQNDLVGTLESSKNLNTTLCSRAEVVLELTEYEAECQLLRYDAC